MLYYVANLMTLAGIFGILSVSLNIIVGYGGIYSVAHAVFFGLGAYAGAQIALTFTTDVLLAALVGGSCATALSLCLALPALRVRGEYFVAASLGLQMVSTTVFSEAHSLTGGLGGLVGIPMPTLLGFELSGPYAMLWVSLAATLIVFTLTWGLLSGSFGRALAAIRDSEDAAAALGKRVATIKTLAVAVSCFFAGISGTIFAFQMAFVNVESFTLSQSMLLLAMVILGGAGTFFGPLVGTLLLLLLPPALSFIPFIPPTEIGVVQEMIYGAAMVLLMIFRPAGIVGKQ